MTFNLTWCKNLDWKWFSLINWICSSIVVLYDIKLNLLVFVWFLSGSILSLYFVFHFMNVVMICMRAAFYFENSFSSILWNFLVLIYFLSSVSLWNVHWFLDFLDMLPCLLFPVYHTFVILLYFQSCFLNFFFIYVSHIFNFQELFLDLWIFVLVLTCWSYFIDVPFTSLKIWFFFFFFFLMSFCVCRIHLQFPFGLACLSG